MADEKLNVSPEENPQPSFSDGRTSEVTSGLSAGEIVVVAG